MRPTILAAALLFLAASAARAETQALPSPDDVFAIAIKPQARQLEAPFTPESLLAALPRFKPAYVVEPIGGKIWKQSGVIVLKDGSVLFWRSFRDDVLAIETAVAPIIYVLEP